MRILYFGTYNPTYVRNSVLMDGLRANGMKIIECHDDSPGLKKFVKLFFKHWKLRNQYDVMVVGFLGQVIMPLAKIINFPLVSFRPTKPIVFDAFMSLYDSNVFGREKIKPKSIKAYYYWLLDWFSMSLGDLVLFDTQQHINYASNEFGIKKRKLAKIFIGAKEDIFYPRPFEKNKDKFKVLFHGTFIKSQGIEFILQAAKLLEGYSDISFTFVGDGQVRIKMEKLAYDLKLGNVTFTGLMPISEIPNYIAGADVCLGLFGKAEKIQRVIATKVFECVAMGKTVLTADTPAIRELFDDKDLMLVDIADAQGIADGILKLRSDQDLSGELAKNGYKKFVEHASTNILGKEFADLILGLEKRTKSV
ncbi:MAG: hypothetical protein A2735_00500 [Candidatus Yanofskybacteria bacterium RIFCSPHIGHO2_01_FULL_41_21]|uniref:Glycosyl transferase family 1 domain-containing protein n=1 Tax=Candidatus Yanofskybacteria bacterium RIFCSPHIGHO2_01_FULL_41_21 TaxID=1802660 RepID=A0A1F8EB98_9BACT|nr:MAG: hypothetical protein A2735_00500 [Candidatus Yanofskybacteria bacterium RIFCSPHIGHO2_01_FULL_41_21]